MGGNLLAVEPTVLDEDFARARPGDDHTGHINAGDVALESYGIADRPALLSRQLYTDAGEEVEVGVVSGEREYKVILQALRASWSIQHDIIGADFQYRTVEVSRDFT